jgi:Glycosidases
MSSMGTNQPAPECAPLPIQAHSARLQRLFEQEAEFRKETIYFLVVDRFCNGNTDNDGIGKKGLYDPSHSQWGHYWGGDLEGIIARADYLRDLGITAVWLSPLFEQVDDIEHGYGPMHGYWTKDFKRVNPHFVRLGEATSLHACETLRRMIDTLRERGLKIVLDIVCNHSSPELNGSKGVVTDDGAPLANFHDDCNHFYHHYPPITDWEDEFQLLRHEMLGLATFNEGNIDFRNYIKSAIMAWLDLGFDALRIDTLKHMPVWFWQEFVTDIQAHQPSTFLFGVIRLWLSLGSTLCALCQRHRYLHPRLRPQRRDPLGLQRAGTGGLSSHRDRAGDGSGLPPLHRTGDLHRKPRHAEIPLHLPLPRRPGTGDGPAADTAGRSLPVLRNRAVPGL